MYVCTCTYFIQTNAFQGIIVTNGNESYAVFTYKCGTLSNSGIRTNGTIGFNSDGNYFRNFQLSGTSKLNEVACLNLPRTLWSNLLYTLTPTSGMSSYAVYIILHDIVHVNKN